MKKPVFTGVCTALVTPFLGRKVNYPMLDRLIRRQLEAGIPAIVLCGTSGESATLSDLEKLAIFQRARACMGEQGILIAGTGSNSTEHAVSLSIHAQQCGADALLVVSPYYNKATPDGLVAHYRAIADAVNIPVILYNVPTRTGVDIPVEVYRQLSAHPNIVGVKEASTDITKILKTRAACPSDFYVWCGNDDMAAAAMALGSVGVISVVSNVLPEITKAMADAALDGDFDTALALQIELLPLTQALFREVNPIPVKAAMQNIGYDCGACRLPLTAPSKETVEILRNLLPKG